MKLHKNKGENSGVLGKEQTFPDKAQFATCTKEKKFINKNVFGKNNVKTDQMAYELLKYQSANTPTWLCRIGIRFY